MKLLPYINFNGNCIKAIAFYEKVFQAKAEGTCFYQDMKQFDPKAEVPKNQEKWVMHSSLKIADGLEIQLSDCADMGPKVGTNICLQLTYENAEEVKAIYNALKTGGTVLCKLSPAFYAPLYGEVVDKFGIRWSIMLPMIQQ